MFGRHAHVWAHGMGRECAPRGFGRGRFGGGMFGDGPMERGPGGPGGRMFGAGDLRLVLLALIAEKPRHGYELIRAIEEKFGGSYAPSPGAVYPTLTMLEEQDLVRSEPDGAKKLYAITPQGEAFLKENEAVVHGVMQRMDVAAGFMAGRTTPDIIREAVHTLRHALAMHRATWTPDEAERVRKLIEDTARQIVIGRTDA